MMFIPIEKKVKRRNNTTKKRRRSMSTYMSIIVDLRTAKDPRDLDLALTASIMRRASV